MYSRVLRRAARDAFQRAARDGEERKSIEETSANKEAYRSQLRAVTSGVYPDRFASPRPFNWSFNRPPLLIYLLPQINQTARTDAITYCKVSDKGLQRVGRFSPFGFYPAPINEERYVVLPFHD